jgi:hypothetical protein
MTRLRVWTGSKWSDVKVWTGTQWKGFIDYVYGSQAYVDDMNALGLWDGSGYGRDVGYKPIWSSWEGGVIYCDYDSAPYGLDVKIFHNWADPYHAFEAPPSTEIRVQAQVWVSIVSGDGNEQQTRSLTVKAELVDPQGSVQYLSGEWILAHAGTGGWVTYTSTTNWSTPANSGHPTALGLRHAWVGYDGGGLATPPNPPTVRLHVNWIRLIGPDGQPLKKKTADAVHGIRVWNGTSWV